MFKLGIISGLGTRISGLFYYELIENFNHFNFQKDSDFPLINLINYPFSLTNFQGNYNSKNLNNDINYILKNFSNYNLIIYLCNSISNLMNDFNHHNIVDISSLIKKIIQNIDEKYILLCSEYSQKHIYMNKYYDIQLQEKSNKIIQNVIQYKNNIFYNKNELQNKIIISACTEIDYHFKINKEYYKDNNIITSTDLLLNHVIKIIKEYYEKL